MVVTIIRNWLNLITFNQSKVPNNFLGDIKENFKILYYIFLFYLKI